MFVLERCRAKKLSVPMRSRTNDVLNLDIWISSWQSDDSHTEDAERASLYLIQDDQKRFGEAHVEMSGYSIVSFLTSALREYDVELQYPVKELLLPEDILTKSWSYENLLLRAGGIAFEPRIIEVLYRTRATWVEADPADGHHIATVAYPLAIWSQAGHAN